MPGVVECNLAKVDAALTKAAAFCADGFVRDAAPRSAKRQILGVAAERSRRGDVARNLTALN